MKRPFSLRGLTPELFLFVVFPLTVLLTIVMFASVSLHQQAMRDMVGERDRRSVQAAGRALSEQLYHRLSAVQGLASQIPAQASEQDLSDLLSGSQFLLPDFDGGLAVYGPHKQLLTSSGDPAAWDMLSASADSKIEKIFRGETAEPALSDAYSVGDKQYLYTAARDPDTGNVVVGAFSTAHLIDHTLMDIISPEHGGVIFLVDQRGQVLYASEHSLEPDALTGHPGVAEALAGQSGSMFMGNQNEHVAAYGPVPMGGWALVIEEGWDSVSNPMLRLTEYAPLVLLPVVVVSLLAMWFATNRIVEPLQRLQERAARLGWGDYQAIEEPVGGISEIRQLQAELAHLAHKVQDAQKGLRDYIGAMTAGQEDERRRLARELHDDTLQALIALNQRVQLLKMQLEPRVRAVEGTAGPGEVEDNGAMKEAVALQDLAGDTIQNLRRLTRALRPIYLEDLGLSTALEMLTREMSQPGLEIEFQAMGQAQRLDPPVELALYRIAQEALSNVVRHAQASQAQVSIHFEADGLHLNVIDNGKGFTPPGSPAAFAPGGHFGLLGMYERAEMIGARLRIQSRPGEGTQLSVHLLPRDGEGFE